MHEKAGETALEAANAHLDQGDVKAAVAQRMRAVRAFSTASGRLWTVDKLHTVRVCLDERDKTKEAEPLLRLDARVRSVTSNLLLTSGDEALAAARSRLEGEGLELQEGDLEEARHHVADAHYAFKQATTHSDGAALDGAAAGVEQVLSLERIIRSKALLLRAQAALAMRRADMEGVMQLLHEGLEVLAVVEETLLISGKSPNMREKETEGELREMLSRVLGKQGRWEEALQEAERCYALRPLAHQSFYALAAAHAALQCHERAEGELALAQALERLRQDAGNVDEQQRLREALGAYTIDRDLLELQARVDALTTSSLLTTLLTSEDDLKTFDLLQHEREIRRRRDSRNHSPTRMEMRQRVLRPSPCDIKHEQDRRRFVLGPPSMSATAPYSTTTTSSKIRQLTSSSATPAKSARAAGDKEGGEGYK
jgi:hypothetical protein